MRSADRRRRRRRTQRTDRRPARAHHGLGIRRLSNTRISVLALAPTSSAPRRWRTSTGTATGDHGSLGRLPVPRLDLPAPYATEKIDWGMIRHDPQNSGWTAPARNWTPLAVPAEIKPGQRLQVQVTATNPANLPLHWSVGNLPEGAYYDVQTHTVFCEADCRSGLPHLHVLVLGDRRHPAEQPQRVRGGRAQRNLFREHGYRSQLDARSGLGLGQTHRQRLLDRRPERRRPHGSERPGLRPRRRLRQQSDADPLRHDRSDRLPGVQEHSPELLCWLGVEAPYDYACVQVSNDGQSWTDLWTTGVSHVSDAAWQLMEYAVPAGLADGQRAVYFRWGMGPTDDFVTCPGWNLDVSPDGTKICF